MKLTWKQRIKAALTGELDLRCEALHVGDPRATDMIIGMIRRFREETIDRLTKDVRTMSEGVRHIEESSRLMFAMADKMAERIVEKQREIADATTAAE